MTNKKSTKRALLLSLLSMLLCITMLVGTTFSWFTDSVTSSGNIIKSGTLEVGMYWADGAADVPSDTQGTWTDAAAGAIFDYSNWEPGFVMARHIKIANEGSLALKYQVNIIPEGEVSDLADVIDVYYADPAVVATRELTGLIRLGTLTEVLAGMGETAKGVLLADGVDTITLALKMQESAGNEYQDKTIGKFAIQLLATQQSYENDSFDENYDKDAVYADHYVANRDDLQDVINSAADGDVIALTGDVVGTVTYTAKKDVELVIDGNGHTFEGFIVLDGKSATYATAGITVKNIVFKADSISADACIRLGDGNNATRYVTNVTIENCTFDVPGAVGVKSYTGGDKNIVIRNCTATANAHSLAQLKGVDGVLVENCNVYSKNGINFNNSTNVTVDGCTVDVKGYAVRFGESKGGSGAAETYLIKNSSLTSANDDGDATIVLRGTADYSTLTIVNTTIVGTPDIANTATGATVVIE